MCDVICNSFLNLSLPLHNGLQILVVIGKSNVTVVIHLTLISVIGQNSSPYTIENLFWVSQECNVILTHVYLENNKVFVLTQF